VMKSVLPWFAALDHQAAGQAPIAAQPFVQRGAAMPTMPYCHRIARLLDRHFRVTGAQRIYFAVNRPGFVVTLKALVTPRLGKFPRHGQRRGRRVGNGTGGSAPPLPCSAAVMIAPTVSVALRSGSACRCAYRCVVTGFECPNNAPTSGNDEPLLTSCEA
jgi:hypothetical protein